MKKQVTKFVEKLSGKTFYSGRKKTMFIYDRWQNLDIPMQSIEGAVLQKFGYNLPFKLQTNEC